MSSPPTFQDIANGRHNQHAPSSIPTNPRTSVDPSGHSHSAYSPYVRHRPSSAASSSMSSVTSSAHNPAAVPLRSSLKKTSTNSSASSVTELPLAFGATPAAGPSNPRPLPTARVPSARSALSANHPKATAAVKNLFAGLHGHRKSSSQATALGIFEPDSRNSTLGSSSPVNGDSGSLYSELSSNGTAVSRKRTIGRVRFSDDDDDDEVHSMVNPSAARPSAERQRTVSAPPAPTSSRSGVPPLPTADSSSTIRPNLQLSTSSTASNATQLFLNPKKTVIKIFHRVST